MAKTIYIEVETDRDRLEALALKICSSENYFDLAGVIDTMTDEDIYAFICCNGDYEKELAWGESQKRAGDLAYAH
jgi:hypothetical protein